MPKRTIHAEGRVRIELINVHTGEMEFEEEFNVLTPAFETHLASVYVGDESPASYIAVGSGAAAEYFRSNQDDFEVLGELFLALGQGVQFVAFQGVQTILLNMKRIGAGAASLWLTIEGVSGSDPDNTPITDGTSQTVLGAALPTDDFDWVAFTFSPPLTTSGSKFMVLHVDDYTYAAASEEIQVGYDASSSTYAGGTLRGDETGDGSSWGPHPVAASDLVFRMVRVMDPDQQDILSNVVDSAALTSLSALTNSVRALAIFGTADANDWLREMWLLPTVALSDPLAMAQINVNKSDQQIMQAYWLISFVRDPEDL